MAVGHMMSRNPNKKAFICVPISKESTKFKLKGSKIGIKMLMKKLRTGLSRNKNTKAISNKYMYQFKLLKST